MCPGEFPKLRRTKLHSEISPLILDNSAPLNLPTFFRRGWDSPEGSSCDCWVDEGGEGQLWLTHIGHFRGPSDPQSPTAEVASSFQILRPLRLFPYLHSHRCSHSANEALMWSFLKWAALWWNSSGTFRRTQYFSKHLNSQH